MPTEETTEAAPLERPPMAFQCRNCGTVEPAGAAGENDLPHACHVCRRGVRWEVSEDGTVVQKVLVPENWIVLADLSHAELKKGFAIHGLKPENVVAHKGVKPLKGNIVTGAIEERTASESVGAKDKADAEV